MTILFAGNEQGEFTLLGVGGVDTATTAARRVANARCSLKVGPNAGLTDGWQCYFPPASSFWLSARMYITPQNTVISQINGLALLDASGVRRIILRNITNSNGAINVVNANNTTLISLLPSLHVGNVMKKIDIQIVYAVAGYLAVYADGVLLGDYTGDTTSGGTTQLAGAVFGLMGNGSSSAGYWSEIIVSTTDTRSLNLVALGSDAPGNAFNWTGSVSDINEVALDDTTAIVSNTPNQIAETTVSTAGIGTAGIAAVVVNARAQKGASGPQNAQLLVRTGDTDYPSSNISLPSSLSTISAVWETNPATGLPWTAAELTAAGFNVGIKSIT